MVTIYKSHMTLFALVAVMSTNVAVASSSDLVAPKVQGEKSPTPPTTPPTTPPNFEETISKEQQHSELQSSEPETPSILSAQDVKAGIKITVVSSVARSSSEQKEFADSANAHQTELDPQPSNTSSDGGHMMQSTAPGRSMMQSTAPGRSLTQPAAPGNSITQPSNK